MSYRIVSLHPGLGSYQLPSLHPRLALAGEACTCEGDEMCEYGSTGDHGTKCCAWYTWNNRTYESVKGKSSIRHKNEQRVRELLRLLLYSTEGYGSGLELAIWQAGGDAAAVTSLVKAIERAAYNFDVIFPVDRWRKDNEGKRTDCQSDGYYSTWKTKGHVSVTPERLAALQDAVPAFLPQTWLDWVARTDNWHMFDVPWRYVIKPVYEATTSMGNGTGTGWEFAKGSTKPWQKALMDWQDAERSAVHSVPGAEPWRNIRSMPTSADLTGLVSLQAGKLQPTGWLARFLGAFAPGWDKLRIAAPLVKLTATAPKVMAVTYRPSLRVVDRYSAGGSIREDEEADTSSRTKAVIGVGVVLAAGAGFLLWRERGRR